jgi:hypothetical protein
MRGPLDGTGTEGWCGVEGEKIDRSNALLSRLDLVEYLDPNECQCLDEHGKPLNQCDECPR